MAKTKVAVTLRWPGKASASMQRDDRNTEGRDPLGGFQSHAWQGTDARADRAPLAEAFCFLWRSHP